MDTELQLAVGYIETFAGNGKARSTGDGKRAVKAGIPLPHHAALDKNERWFYFAESGSDRIRRIDLQEGTLHNFAGIGETCYSGDEGPCGEAGLYLPLDVAFGFNYGYLGKSKPNGTTMIDALGPWPGRVVVIVGLVALVMALMTLPWEVVRRSKLRSAAREAVCHRHCSRSSVQWVAVAASAARAIFASSRRSAPTPLRPRALRPTRSMPRWVTS